MLEPRSQQASNLNTGILTPDHCNDAPEASHYPDFDELRANNLSSASLSVASEIPPISRSDRVVEHGVGVG